MALGFGCMIGFARMCSLGFVGYLSYEVSSALDPWYALRTGCMLVTFAVLAFAGRNGWFSLGLKSFAVSSTFAMASAIIFAVDVSEVARPLVAVMGGVSMAVFMYVWMLLLSRHQPRVIVGTTLSGLLLAGIIIEGAPLVGPDVGLVIAVAAAFGAGAAAVLIDADLQSCRADGPLDEAARARIPWLTVVMVVACGFFVSVLYGVSEYMTWLYDWRPNYVVFGFSILAVVAATALIVVRSRNWMHIAWIPLFVLFALAVVFACLPMRSTVQVAVGFMMAAMFSAHFLYWMIFPSILSTLNASRAFSAGILLICVSSSLASLVGDALGSVLPRSMQNLGSVAGIMAIAVAVLFAVVLIANRSRAGIAGMSADGPIGHAELGKLEESQLVTSPLDVLQVRIDECVVRYGLTPREAEVAFYTVQGFSCAYIAEKLVVSNSTVRFHQQNIYRKLEVHSRNELIELVSVE